MEAANAYDDRPDFATHTAELSRAIFSTSSEIGRAFNKEKVLSLINFKSIAHIGRSNIYYVDIIRDVITLLPIQLISEEVVRPLFIVVSAALINTYLQTSFPLTTNVSPNGTWSEYAISEKFADISECVLLTASSAWNFFDKFCLILWFRYIFMAFDPENDWRLREGSQESARECIEIIKGNIEKSRKVCLYTHRLLSLLTLTSTIQRRTRTLIL